MSRIDYFWFGILYYWTALNSLLGLGLGSIQFDTSSLLENINWKFIYLNGFLKHNYGIYFEEISLQRPYACHLHRNGAMSQLKIDFFALFAGKNHRTYVNYEFIFNFISFIIVTNRRKYRQIAHSPITLKYKSRRIQIFHHFCLVCNSGAVNLDA